jgi:hypothetical protein
MRINFEYRYKFQLRASRYQQCQDYGVSVISGWDPASLQGVRNVTHDIEEIPNEIPDIKENPPVSRCIFSFLCYFLKMKTQTLVLFSSNDDNVQVYTV